jgi:hypothetical protein
MPDPQGEQPANDPKADCEALMNFLLPFAEQMLSSHGEFLPFGVMMRSNGELAPVAGYDGDEHPQSADLIRLIKEGFVQSARKGEAKATALAYDMRIKLSPTGESSDAIAVSMNHRDNYSIVVIFPYKIDSGKLTMGSAFAQKGEGDIFPP